eukprot:m.707391 g.707391  ORF g.707391 m.707391 type:complete len:122 (-) comp22935_c0_seq48:3897-4262(-)
MLVTLGPSTTFPFIGGDNPRFPFHLWDFMCATQTWDYFSLGRYRPQARDLELGARIRSMWLDLSTLGYIRDSSGCNAVTGVAAEQSVCVVGSTVVTVPGYKSPTCDSLEALGFGKRYWWIN